jgi:hypothetical protein
MQSARARWAAEYRANRAASRLWNFLIDKAGKIGGVPSFVESTPNSFGFIDSRLSGDFLWYGACVANPHRLALLRMQRVRLPA